MLIEALVPHLKARSRLRAALRGSLWERGPSLLRFHEEWSVLLAALQAGGADLFVVDPCYPNDEPPPVERINALMRHIGWGRTVLYLSPGLRDSHLLAELTGEGAPHVLVSGTDDDPSSVRATLGKASAHGFLARVVSGLKEETVHSGQSILTRVLAAALSCDRVEELADAMQSKPRDLSTLTRRWDLPPPRRILLWGRLIRAEGLRSLTGETLARVAFMIGYDDVSSLCRLYRNLLGCASHELARETAASLVAERLLREFSSA